jgi:serine/threonine protein kinase
MPGQALRSVSSQPVPSHPEEELVISAPAHHPIMTVRPGSRVGDCVADMCIGQGAFATAWKATDRRSGKTVVLKNIDRSKVDSEELNAEIQTMRALHHTHILRLLCVHPPAKTNQVLVLEYCNHGDLGKFINGREKPLSEANTQALMRQLSKGLRCMLENGVLHRDLKPDNLLLTELESGKLLLKIADFGSACFADPTRRPELKRVGEADTPALQLVSLGRLNGLATSGRAHTSKTCRGTISLPW